MTTDEDFPDVAVPYELRLTGRALDDIRVKTGLLVYLAGDLSAGLSARPSCGAIHPLIILGGESTSWASGVTCAGVVCTRQVWAGTGGRGGHMFACGGAGGSR